MSSVIMPPRTSAALLTACMAADLALPCWRSRRATRRAGAESHSPSDAMMRRAPVGGRRTCGGRAAGGEGRCGDERLRLQLHAAALIPHLAVSEAPRPQPTWQMWGLGSRMLPTSRSPMARPTMMPPGHSRTGPTPSCALQEGPLP